MPKQNNHIQSKKTKVTFSRLFLPILPLILIAAIVPLLVKLHIVKVPEKIITYWISGGVHLDFFSYSKMIAFLSLCGVLILWVISFFLATDFSFERMRLQAVTNPQKGFQRFYMADGKLAPQKCIYILLSVYMLFTLISCVFSRYPEVAFGGFPDRYEGFWVLLGYALVLISTIILVEDVRQIYWVVGAIVFCGVVIGVIGIGQFFGHDFFRTDLGKMMIVPAQHEAYRADLEFSFGAKTIYATLFNTNNVGSMMSMLTLMGLSFTLLVKNLYVKLGFGLFTILSAFTLLGSNSRGGYMGALAGVVILLILLGIQYRMNLKFAGIALGIVVVIGCIFVLGQGKFNNLSRVNLETLLGINQTVPQQDQPVATRILGFHGEGNKVKLSTDAGNLFVFFDGEQISFQDADGVVLPMTETGETVVVEDSRFSSIPILHTKNEIKVTMGWELIFSYQDGEVLFLDTSRQLVKTIENPPTIPLLEKYGFMGSMRGAIWSRSIPMLKDTLLFGYGADCYAMHFPQWDYTSKITYFGSPFIIVDKPHNQYLQIALNQGLVALLSLLGALGFYFYYAVFQLRKVRTEQENPIQRKLKANIIAFTSAMVAYLVTGIFNDSILSIASIFWLIWGLAMASVKLCKQAETGGGHL